MCKEERKMKTIGKGLLAVLATAGLTLAPGLIGGAFRNVDAYTSAQIIGRGDIESNTPYTLAREIRDTDNDGDPDTTFGYSVCFRSPVITSGEPTDAESAEFYRQKKIWEDR